jgi:hypothetical protein
MSNILAKTKAGTQREDCRSCKDSIGVFALYACYHKALCGTCVSKLRSLFDVYHCYACGKVDHRVCFTWRPTAEYEDFGNPTGADDKAFDEETEISYEDFGMRNRGRKAIRDGQGRQCTPEEQVRRRNATCKIVADGKHVGTGLLIKVKGHLCVLTSNYILPDRITAQSTIATFHVHTAEPELSCAPARRRVRSQNAFSYQVDQKQAVGLDPACYFVTNIILDFTCVSIAVPSPFDPDLVQPVPLPRAWDPKAERRLAEAAECERLKREEQKRREEAGEETKRTKYNFVIVKKKKVGDEDGRAVAEMKPEFRDGMVVCGFPVPDRAPGGSATAKSKSKSNSKSYFGAAGIVAQLVPDVDVCMDVVFLERTENQFVQYTTDVGNGWQGAPLFFNMELYGLHSQPKIKDNSDEAILVSRIVHFLDSVRSEAVNGITSGMLARPDSQSIQTIGCHCLHTLLEVDDHVNMSQLVRCNAMTALVAATKRWAIAPDVLNNSLESLRIFCREDIYHKWIGKVGGVSAFLAVIRAQMTEVRLIEMSWECLSLILSTPENLHQFALEDGPSAALTMIRSFVSSKMINRFALDCVEKTAKHARHHAALLKMHVVDVVLLSISAHQENVNIQVSGCLAVAHLLLSDYPLPCDNAMQLKPLSAAAEPPKKPKAGGRSRRHGGRQGRHGRGRRGMKAEQEQKLVIPVRVDGRRDRQLMKRDHTATQLTTAATELGAKVNAQPRIIIMRTHGGLDALFMALKAFPKELHIVEPCWRALRAVADETRADISMRTGHVRVLERTLKKCKKHPLHGEWTATLEKLMGRNTNEKASKSKRK